MMKKQILNLGKALNKAEQKSINGGGEYCDSPDSCPTGQCCSSNNTCRINDGNTLCIQQPPFDW
jgi:hypothetical protein